MLITYFQLISSIPRSFPLVAGKKTAESSDTSVATQAFSRKNSTEPVGATGPLDSMKEALQPVLDALGNINVQAIDMVQCIVGPRYIDRLTFTSVLVVGSIGIAWAIVGVIQLRACAGGRSRAAAATNASSVATAVSIQVLFLLYPLSCAFILRTWVCDDYNVNGQPMTFMADDKFVECSSPEYVRVHAVASALVAVVVFGMPALQYFMLRPWRKPFNRLTVPTEDGYLVPSDDAALVVGDLFILYKPDYPLGALADAAFKLVFTAVLGVLFKGAQQTGLVISGILCVVCGFSFAIYKPLTYPFANHIVLATYVYVY